MGCCASNAATARFLVEKGRRRLSVDHVTDADQESSNEVTEDMRGLITQLEAKDITEMLDSGSDRKMSIGSAQDNSNTSFGEKRAIRQEKGIELRPEVNFLGHTCRKGLKPESPNQDSWFILQVDNLYSVYAVFDGHGPKGHEVSNFVKDNLPKLMIRDPRWDTPELPHMMADTFKKTQSLVGAADRLRKLNAQKSGTTASVVMHDHRKNKLTVAHVADSTAVLGKFKNREREEMEARALTRDHRPQLEDERARIEGSGGRVAFDGYANHRVYAQNARYPGLNMSRCIGDLMGHQDCGIIAEPEVSELDIEPEDHVLLVCSDGVWEFIRPCEAVGIVSRFPPEQAMQAAEALAKEAWDRWFVGAGGQVVDDITAIVVYLNTDTH